jgi:hypothetical protein
MAVDRLSAPAQEQLAVQETRSRGRTVQLGEQGIGLASGSAQGLPRR